MDYQWQGGTRVQLIDLDSPSVWALCLNVSAQKNILIHVNFLVLLNV